jgi:Flp pilus assembly protein TadD
VPSQSIAFRSLCHLRKALELDASIGEAHDTLGLLSWRFEWDWDAAEREFNQAIALAPSYSCAHEDRSVYLSFIGRRAEALAEIAKSKEMDPGPSSAMAESAAYYQLRDYAGLVEASRRGVVSNPNEWTQHANLGVGYEGTGKLLEAISEYQKAVEMSGGDQDATASLAHAYAMIGRRAEAERILLDLERNRSVSMFHPIRFRKSGEPLRWRLKPVCEWRCSIRARGNQRFAWRLPSGKRTDGTTWARVRWSSSPPSTVRSS